MIQDNYVNNQATITTAIYHPPYYPSHNCCCRCHCHGYWYYGPPYPYYGPTMVYADNGTSGTGTVTLSVNTASNLSGVTTEGGYQVIPCGS